MIWGPEAQASLPLCQPTWRTGKPNPCPREFPAWKRNEAKTIPQMVHPSWLERGPADLGWGEAPGGSQQEGRLGPGQARHPAARAQNFRMPCPRTSEGLCSFPFSPPPGMTHFPLSVHMLFPNKFQPPQNFCSASLLPLLAKLLKAWPTLPVSTLSLLIHFLNIDFYRGKIWVPSW